MCLDSVILRLTLEVQNFNQNSDDVVHFIDWFIEFVSLMTTYLFTDTVASSSVNNAPCGASSVVK